MDSGNRVENILKDAAELPVVLVVHGLQVNLVEVHPGTNVVEHLSRAVAVGDVSGVETAPLRLLENGDRPLGSDEGLVVSGNDGRRAAFLRQAGQSLGRDVVRLCDCLGITDGLRGEPVLAVCAVQVAAEHPEGKSVGPVKCMEERLLLDRIALQRSDVTPRNAQHAPLVVAHPADALAALRDRAAVAAGIAPQPPVGKSLDELERRRCRAARENGGDRGGGRHRVSFKRITPPPDRKCLREPLRYDRSMSMQLRALRLFLLCLLTAPALKAQTATTVPAGTLLAVDNSKSVSGVRIDTQPDGSVWFLVPSNDRIVQLQSDGVTMKQWQIRADKDLGANPVDFKIDGNIVWFIENGESLVDAGRSVLGRLDTTTGQLREWIAPGSVPAGFYLAPDGKVWLPQTNGRLQSMDLTTLDVVDFRSTKTFAYSGLAVASDGTFWMTDFGNNRIVHYAPGAEEETTWTC